MLALGRAGSERKEGGGQSVASSQASTLGALRPGPFTAIYQVGWCLHEHSVSSVLRVLSGSVPLV